MVSPRTVFRVGFWISCRYILGVVVVHIWWRRFFCFRFPLRWGYVLFCWVLLAQYASHRHLSWGIAWNNTDHYASAFPAGYLLEVQNLLYPCRVLGLTLRATLCLRSSIWRLRVALRFSVGLTLTLAVLPRRNRGLVVLSKKIILCPIERFKVNGFALHLRKIRCLQIVVRILFNGIYWNRVQR